MVLGYTRVSTADQKLDSQRDTLTAAGAEWIFADAISGAARSCPELEDDPDPEPLAGGRPLPHIYRDPLRIGLYLPGTREQEARKRIDRTVIPWTHIWLYYFEEWLWLDDWTGERQHPWDEREPVGNRALRYAKEWNLAQRWPRSKPSRAIPASGMYKQF